LNFLKLIFRLGIKASPGSRMYNPDDYRLSNAIRRSDANTPIHARTYIHTRIHIPTHVPLYSYVHMPTRPYTTFTHIHMHPVHSYDIFTRPCSSTHTCLHTLPHLQMYTNTHTNKHAPSHTYIHTHIHMHRRLRRVCLWPVSLVCVIVLAHLIAPRETKSLLLITLIPFFEHCHNILLPFCT
jgi:hypothetical protein